MSLTDKASEILVRFADECGRSNAVLRCDRDTCVAGTALADGPWGVALSFAESARAQTDRSLRDFAKRLADVPGRNAARGIFAGSQGRLAAQMAANGKQSEEITANPANSTKPGDLMDGEIGEHWGRLCLGHPPFTQSLDWRKVDARSATGLAHGRLGAIACIASSLESDELEQLIVAHAPLDRYGWCNGSAGTAVAAHIAWAATGTRSFAEMAEKEISKSLRAVPLETDGLCHGSAGVLVVASGIARATSNSELLSVTKKMAEMCWAENNRPLRLNKGFLLDQSWLTGSSGIAWALSVVERRPLINPLCPLDSEYQMAAPITQS